MNTSNVKQRKYFDTELSLLYLVVTSSAIQQISFRSITVERMESTGCIAESPGDAGIPFSSGLVLSEEDLATIGLLLTSEMSFKITIRNGVKLITFSFLLAYLLEVRKVGRTYSAQCQSAYFPVFSSTNFSSPETRSTMWRSKTDGSRLFIAISISLGRVGEHLEGEVVVPSNGVRLRSSAVSTLTR